MRTAKQVKAVTAQLEALGELKEQLQDVLAYIDNVLQKGTSWINEKENTSFNEITSFLANKTSDCFQKCLNLANGNEELAQSQPVGSLEEDKGISSSSVSNSLSACFTDKEYQKLTEEIKVMEKIIAKQSKTLKAMKTKNAEQEKEVIEKIQQLKEDMERKNDLKIKEIMTELQAASNFMSELQGKSELLTNEMNEKFKQQNDLLEQKLNTFTKENVGKADYTKTVELDEIKKTVSKNCDDIREIKSQSGTMLILLKDVEKKLEDVSLMVDPLNADKEGLNIQIRNVSTKVDEILQRINKNDLALGFDACVETIRIYCDEVEILTCFTNVIQDLGNNFDKHKGIYTVPVDGVYLCSMFIEIDSYVRNEIFFGIFLKPNKVEVDEEDEIEIIAYCHTKMKGQTVCDATFRKLKSGDQLYIQSKTNKQNIELSTNSHFTCVLLKHC